METLERLKWCNKCQTWKDKNNFYRDKQRKDRLCVICKSCNAKHVQAWRHSKGTIPKEQHKQEALNRIEKECIVCNIVKPLTEFYNKPGIFDGKQARCKNCQSKYNAKRHNEKKQKLLDYLGNKCVRCGIAPNELWPICSFEFHHKDKSMKDHEIKFHVSFEKLLKEVEKCEVLCANCHRAEHYFNGTAGRERSN